MAGKLKDQKEKEVVPTQEVAVAAQEVVADATPVVDNQAPVVGHSTRAFRQ